MNPTRERDKSRNIKIEEIMEYTRMKVYIIIQGNKRTNLFLLKVAHIKK